MFNTAVEWELLEESLMQGIKFLRENNARTRYLSLDECQLLIASCIAPYTRAVITLALQTGMRLGEILNLRWQDLDSVPTLSWCAIPRMATRVICRWTPRYQHCSGAGLDCMARI
jgi:integrase